MSKCAELILKTFYLKFDHKNQYQPNVFTIPISNLNTKSNLDIIFKILIISHSFKG